MSERKKIVFAINNLGMGGAENMLIEQVRHIDQSHFETYIITLLSNPKINILSKIPMGTRFLEFNFSNLLNLNSFYKLWKFLREEKVDAIITNLFVTNFIVRIVAVTARVPVILSYEHNVYQYKKNWQIVVDHLLAYFTNKILVSSIDVLEFTSKQEFLPKSKFQLNPNSISLKLGEAKRDRVAVLHKYGLPKESLYIVAVGSLTKQKGHTYLIDSVYEMKQRGVFGFRVLIFGNGILESELVNKIEKLGLTEEIRLMGFKPIEEIVAISDIFTMPSLWEGLSIALLQAMNAGCPIVSTKVSGANEVIENNINGILVDAKNSHQLALALESLLGEPMLRKKLAKEAKEKVKGFSIEKNVKVIENLIIYESDSKYGLK